MTRRKAAALSVPASQAEAAELVAAYVAGERDALSTRLRAEVAIDEVKASRDSVLVAIEAEQKQRFAALKAWWEAGGAEIAKGLRSAELAGAKLGVRLTPPKVKFAKGINEKIVVAWLGAIEWARAKEFVRFKVELDKPAVIKAFAADAIAEAFADRLSVVQDDEFFIDCGLDEAAIAAETTKE